MIQENQLHHNSMSLPAESYFNKVNIGICGMKDPKALSSANSNFTFVQAP